MTPVRVALVGLSARPSGYGWLNNFHFPAIRSHSPSSFQITALLNSSLPAAEAARSKFDLPSSVRIYDSPEALAKDGADADADGPEGGVFDLIVVGVKAPLHRDILVPSLLQKPRPGRRQVFVEWPIDTSLERTREIVEMVKREKEKGGRPGGGGAAMKTAVGLQGRFSALNQRLKAIVDSGRIGKVLSTTAVGTVPTGDGKSEKLGVKYSLDRDSGATMVDVHFAHFMEGLTHVLGPVKRIQGLVKTMHDTTDIVDDVTGEIVEKGFRKTAPDQVVVGAELAGRAVLSLHMRGGDSVGDGFRWTIYGTEGVVEVAGLRMVTHIWLGVPWKLKLKTADGVSEEEVGETTSGQPAVKKLWDAFVEGEEGGWPDFEHALKIHEIVDGVWRSDREGRMIELESSTQE